MATKNIGISVIIGGAIAGSLKSALGSTRSGLNEVGSAINSLKARQKELNAVISEQEKLGRSGSALKVQYANQELGIINKQIEALRRKQQIINQSQKGMEAGRLKAKSMPVTTALKSPKVLCLFMALRERNSLTTLVITVTAVRASTRGPKKTTAAIRAGIMAMITSSMMPVVVAPDRTWGEALTVSFLSKTIL